MNIGVIYGRLFRRPTWLVAGALAVLPVAVWLCARIRLDTDLFHLMPEGVPAVAAFHKLDRWSGSWMYFYAGLVRDERSSCEDLKRFADAFAAGIGKSRWVHPGAEASMEFGALRKGALLALAPDDVPLVAGAVHNSVLAERRKRSGFFLELEEPAAAPGIEAVLARHAKALGFGASAAPAGGVLQRLRDVTSDDGKRLYLLSPDARMLTFSFRPIFPPSDLSHYPELIADIGRAEAGAHAEIRGAVGIRVHHGGGYPLQWDQRVSTLRDALRAALVSALLIFLVVAVTVRRARTLLCLLVSLAAGMLLAFGLFDLVAGTLNVITAFFLAVLAGFGIDFGLYLATRYHRYLAAGSSRDAAMREAWRQTVVPSSIGAITSISAMIVISFGRLRGFADVGIIGAIGIACIFLSMYVLLPALLLVLDRPLPPAGPAPSAGRKETSQRARGPAARWILVAAVVVSVAAAVSARRTRLTYTGDELSSPGQPSLDIYREFLAHYGENLDRSIVLADTEARAREIQSYFDENAAGFREIARYESAASYVAPRERQEETLRRLPILARAMDLLPRRPSDPVLARTITELRSLLNAEVLTFDRLPGPLRSLLLGHDPAGRTVGFLGYVSARSPLHDLDELQRYVDEVEAIRVGGQPLEVTGYYHIFYRVIRIVEREAKLFSAVALFAIFAALWIQFRRLSFTLLALSPLLVGLLWTIGAMPMVGASGAALPFLCVGMVPVLVGLAVSYGVQVLHAFRLYGSAEQALRVTGRPVLGSALTTLVGWGSLLTASTFGMQAVGRFTTVGMLAVTVFSLTVLPAALAVLHRGGWIAPDRTAEIGAT